MAEMVMLKYNMKDGYLVNLDKVDSIQEVKQQGYEDVIINFSNKEKILLPRINIATVIKQIKESK